MSTTATALATARDYKFLWAGFQLAKPLTPGSSCRHSSGQFEFGGNIMPLWQAYTPAPHQQTFTCLDAGGTDGHLRASGRRRHLSRRQPYAGHLPLELSHPVAALSALVSGRRRAHLHHPQVSAECAQHADRQSPGIDGGTCVWNFSPQGGVGFHYFTRAKRSIDVGVNAVHISSASLGDRNPGVNASIQIQVGYTFWK